mgnify:CR=1 FL=1
MIRTYNNFAGGKNSHGVPTIIVDEGQTDALAYASDSYNWEMSEKGLIKVPGWEDVITSPADAVVTGDFEYNGATKKRILCKGTNVYTVAGGVETEVYPLAGADQTAGAYYQACEWDDGSGVPILILMNGVDKPLVYNGTTCAQATYTDPDTVWGDARPFAATVFRGRIFYITATEVITPIPGTYNDFTDSTGETDRFQVDAGFGGDITGILAFTDDILMIYKERCIRRLSGSSPFGATSDPFYLAPVTNDYGCVAPRTLVQIGLEHYFLSAEGIRNLKPYDKYGDIEPLLPTYAIQDEVLEWNWSDITDACAAFLQKDNHYYFAVPYGTSSENNKLYTLDVITKGIDPRKTDDVLVSSLCVYDRAMYHGDYHGQLFEHGSVNSANGSDHEAQWSSKLIAHYSLGRWKRYNRLCLFAEADGNGDVLVEWQILAEDQISQETETATVQATASLWDTALWDSAVWNSGSEKIFATKNLGRGHAIRLRLTNISAEQRPIIRCIDLNVEPLGEVLG